MSHHHHKDVTHQASSDTLSLEEKLTKLLDHWVHHNHDHAKTYRDWSSQAKAIDLNEVARLLEEAALLTDKISAKFDTAANLLKSKA